MNACASGKCTPDLSAVSEIAGCGMLELVMAPGTLYALSTKKAALYAIATPAGGAPTAVATGLKGGVAFAVDATNAYVATGKSVTQVNLASGAKTVLVTELNPVFDVAVAAGKIYYATGQAIKQADAATPGTGTSVATSIDEGEPRGVAIAENRVVYVSNQSYNVESDPIVGDMHLKIGASQAGLIFGHRSVQTDGNSVYWVNGGLQAAQVSGPDLSARTVASPIDGSPIIAFAIDATTKTSYLATMDGRLEKSEFDLGSDEAIWVARALPAVSSVVLDDNNVYLASQCQIFSSPR